MTAEIMEKELKLLYERRARNAALEEAAKAVEQSEIMCEHGCTDRFARIIRALKGKR